MKPNLVIMSHGHMAEEILASAKMIVGDITGATYVCMEEKDGLEGTKAKLNEVVTKLQDTSILIIADLYGGTPFNVGLMLAKSRINTEILSGLNLNMIIEYALTKIENVQELKEHLYQVGKQAVMTEKIDADDEIEIG